MERSPRLTPCDRPDSLPVPAATADLTRRRNDAFPEPADGAGTTFAGRRIDDPTAIEMAKIRLTAGSDQKPTPRSACEAR